MNMLCAFERMMKCVDLDNYWRSSPVHPFAAGNRIPYIHGIQAEGAAA